MAKINLIEARLLCEALYERIDWVRRQINDYLTYQSMSKQEVETVSSEMVPAPGMDVEQSKEVMTPRKPEKNLEELYEELESLQLEKNKLTVAMAQFESTVEFDY